MKTETIVAPTSKEALIKIRRQYGLNVSIIKTESVSEDGRKAVAITFVLIGEIAAESSETGPSISAALPLQNLKLLRYIRTPLILASVVVLTFAMYPLITNLMTPSIVIPDLLSRDELMDEIGLLINDFDKPGAYKLARQAQNRFPDDPKLVQLWPEIVAAISINTDPTGAKVYRKRYLSPEDEWEYLGESPLEGVEFPKGFSRVKFEKNGYVPLTLFAGPGDLHEETVSLRSVNDPYTKMVFAKGYNQQFKLRATKLENNFGIIGDFLIDKYEVTNRQYYEFVKARGYKNPVYWKEPFIKNGEVLSWKDAIAYFVDSTSQPGPATWEAGIYPNGKGDHPVSGVSWYEAAAYAEFVGKELPTAFHWCYAATINWAYIQYPFGNFQGTGTVPVGSSPTVGQFGTYDLPGNVREWCYNAVGDRRCLLGGAWNDNQYMFQSGQWFDPFDRSEYNGFRCIKDLENDDIAKADLRRILQENVYRDVTKVKPVSDEKFKEYLDSFFAYDPEDLEPELVNVDDSSEYWRREKVFINCAYNTEQMAVYLFLPRDTTPPYQPVMFFPGRKALVVRESDNITLSLYNDHYVKSGRAFIYPIFWGTYERGEFNRDENGTLKKFTIDDSITVRDYFINWAKDASRTIDYLETRKDIDCSRITAVGLSSGGGPSIIAVAVEPRFRCFIMLSDIVNPSGIVRPEADSINYISRVTVPTLYITGSVDPGCSLEYQNATFDLLGTPPKYKKHVILDGGHSVYMLSSAKRECLQWLDMYLGPVNK